MQVWQYAGFDGQQDLCFAQIDGPNLPAGRNAIPLSRVDGKPLQIQITVDSKHIGREQLRPGLGLLDGVFEDGEGRTFRIVTSGVVASDSPTRTYSAGLLGIGRRLTLKIVGARDAVANPHAE